MASNSNQSIAAQIKVLIEAFKLLEDPSISDVTLLSSNLNLIIEGINTDNFDTQSLVSSVDTLLGVFVEEGLSTEQYSIFYDRLMDDTSETELLVDIQSLIYTFLVESAISSNQSNAIVTSTTLSLSRKYNELLYILTASLLTSNDYGLTTIQWNTAFVTFATAFVPKISTPYSYDDITKIWNTVLQSFRDTNVGETLITSIDNHFSALLTIVRNLNYSSFASGIYTTDSLIASFSNVINDNPNILSRDIGSYLYITDFKDRLAKNAINGTTTITGKNLIPTFKGYQNTLVGNACLPIFNNYSDIQIGSQDSLVLPSLFTTSVTDKLGLYALKFDKSVAEVLFGSVSIFKRFSLTYLTGEDQINVQNLLDQRTSQDLISYTEIAETSAAIFSYLSDKEVNADALANLITEFHSELKVIQEVGIVNYLGTVVKSNFYSPWSAALRAKISTFSLTTGNLAILNIVDYLQTFLFSENNTPENGLSVANFIQMEIEILGYLSLFLSQEQLDELGDFMNDFIAQMPAEQEAEKAESEAIEMWIQIGVSIALLIVTIVVTVLTLGVGTGAVVALDVAVEAGAEIALEAGIEAAAEAAAEATTEGLAEGLAEGLTDTATEVTEAVTEVSTDAAAEGLGETATPEAEVITENMTEPIEEIPEGEPLEEEVVEETEEEGSECTKNLASFFKAASEDVLIGTIVASVGTVVEQFYNLNVSLALDAADVIINSVADTWGSLCSNEAIDESSSKKYLTLAESIASEIPAIIDLVLSKIEDPSEELITAQGSVNFISGSLYAIIGLYVLIQMAVALAIAGGAFPTTTFLESIKTIYASIITLMSSIETLGLSVDYQTAFGVDISSYFSLD